MAVQVAIECPSCKQCFFFIDGVPEEGVKMYPVPKDKKCPNCNVEWKLPGISGDDPCETKMYNSTFKGSPNAAG